jgi:hypothetical protein
MNKNHFLYRLQTPGEDMGALLKEHSELTGVLHQYRHFKEAFNNWNDLLGTFRFHYCIT